MERNNQDSFRDYAVIHVPAPTNNNSPRMVTKGNYDFFTSEKDVSMENKETKQIHSIEIINGTEILFFIQKVVTDKSTGLVLDDSSTPVAIQADKPIYKVLLILLKYGFINYHDNKRLSGYSAVYEQRNQFDDGSQFIIIHETNYILSFICRPGETSFSPLSYYAYGEIDTVSLEKKITSTLNITSINATFLYGYDEVKRQTAIVDQAFHTKIVSGNNFIISFYRRANETVFSPLFFYKNKNAIQSDIEETLEAVLAEQYFDLESSNLINIETTFKGPTSEKKAA